MNRHDARLLLAAAAVDAAGRCFRPAAVLSCNAKIVAAGPRDDVRRRVDRERLAPGVIDRRGSLVAPALVNAHAHLDLSDAEPAPFEGDFVAWLERVIAHRRGASDAPASIAAAVRRGLERSRAAGVGVVGDVAGSRAALAARLDASREAGRGLPGVSFLEFLGRGPDAAERLNADAAWLFGVRPPDGVRVGFSPHAPYSVSPIVYERVSRLCEDHALPWQTHLAESHDEVVFIKTGGGPLAAMLRRLGREAEPADHRGLHPVESIRGVLGGRASVVHCNVIRPPQVRRLKDNGAAVVYCPRASAYFGHADHPYREMLDQGVPVALGTDSALCHDDPLDAHSVLAEMRLLRRRDATPPATLLAMATRHGRAALGLPPLDGELAEGAAARFTAIEIEPRDGDPLDAALAGHGAAELIEL